MATETLWGITLEHPHRAEAGAQLVAPYAQRQIGFNVLDRVVPGVRA